MTSMNRAGGLPADPELRMADEGRSSFVMARHTDEIGHYREETLSFP